MDEIVAHQHPFRQEFSIFGMIKLQMACSHMGRQKKCQGMSATGQKRLYEQATNSMY